ncbi:nicotinate-nucleotide adenylyltransferase [Ahrensia sp. R2A130]|uniref:nicotinate-nucleotide adenylyltransferase n=1 Tax=Ahrensia sp. R2A130 TaxID=744979 RepID=UPI00058DECEB|nr:nicotinate-nucleotide adenylyltransferase [Ahrensia sp. R2A130]
MPMVESGMRVGLFGGSFNPPHAGHVHVCEQAMRRCELDAVWWLVTPGNPLKDTRELAPLTERVAECEAITPDPRMKITACEIDMPTRYTADTLRQIVARNRDVDFVWIMGADNLGQFHQWDRWRDIAALMPFVVVDRPGSTLALHSAKAAQVLRPYRFDEADASTLPGTPAPAWTFLHGPRNSLSSTQLRQAAKRHR